ncbi:hypothetical protein DSO57_1032892 [Entomophthora muscae]|uniref:Uncharacterized protein n=1 Tax=Entomophthora muscae TaxID=34485 RepID=A0ACC2REZ0_9FUNG|nr:hypothetical protein DSO57_1032892 [Entomophthora muscae]
MAIIWRELDTGSAIGSHQHRVDASETMVKEDKEYIPRQTQPVSSSKHMTRSSSWHYVRHGKRISVEVPARRIPQTVTKDISDYDLISNEEVDKIEKSNVVEEGSPSDNLDQ